MEQTPKMTPEMFKILSVEEKRVEVAKDVIGQILAKRYIANTGSYVENIEIEGMDVDENGYRIYSRERKEKIADWDIRDSFDKIKRCDVCAMGACILSITKFENQLKFSDIGVQRDEFSTKTDELISQIFTPNQLAIMEVMFEGNWEPGDTHNYAADRMQATPGAEQINAAKWFYEDHKAKDEYDDNEDCIGNNEAEKAEERLIGIMENIIVNKGQLVLGGKAVV